MKIIGFGQLRNELENGNLENWFNCLLPICNYIYIFDQNSTDGSLEYYKKFNNVFVIASNINRFKEELKCKQELLDKIKKEQPDTSFIQWLDGDELLDGRLVNNGGYQFKKLCEELIDDKNHGYLYGHKNLWRSDIYERVDDQYDWLDKNGTCKLWKFSKNICFKSIVGLHNSAYFPVTLTKLKRIDYSLIHRGFATDYQIIKKYENYKSFGQQGWDLDRLFKEETLTVKKIDNWLLPEQFKVTDTTDPTTKKRIIDIYNETKH